VFCQSSDPDSPATYLPPALRRELLDRFDRSREHLDEELRVGGVGDFTLAADNARRFLGGA
jgi:hypothetical protein